MGVRAVDIMSHENAYQHVPKRFITPLHSTPPLERVSYEYIMFCTAMKAPDNRAAAA